MKILIAYDGSPAAEAAVDEVARRPWPPASRVLLVTILNGLASAPRGAELYGPVYERLRSSCREAAHARIKQAMKRLEIQADLDVRYEMRDGRVKSALLDSILDWRPDLVVTGCDGSDSPGGSMIGSVCHALIHRAPCSVEVIKPRDDDPVVLGKAQRT